MRLSIVMPAYNGIKYVKQAVDSALAQDFDSWELLISDDGSVDGTREYLSSIRHPRAKVFFQPHNLGIFGNLNFLVSQARGEITQVLCQDDYFSDRSALGRLMQLWSSLPKEIAFLRCNLAGDHFSFIQRYQITAVPSVVRPEVSDLLFFVFGCVAGNLSNMSIRTHIVEDMGWFRPDLPFAGDFEFWSRAGGRHPWAVSRTVISVIRFHEEAGSVQLNKRGELLPQMRVILDRLYRGLVEKGFSPRTLRLMATVHHISYQRDRGVRRALAGQGLGYLRGVSRELDQSAFSLGQYFGWMLYFASLGGRVLSVPVARHILSTAGIGPQNIACGRSIKDDRLQP